VISVILMSQGDDAGVGMGVMSGTILGPCQYKLGSATVMIEGTAAPTWEPRSGTTMIPTPTARSVWWILQVRKWFRWLRDGRLFG
jgi:hypothetical protein